MEQRSFRRASPFSSERFDIDAFLRKRPLELSSGLFHALEKSVV